MRFRCHWTRINRFVSTLSFWYVFDCPHVTASFLVVLGNFGCDVICWIARTGLGTRLRSDRIARYDVSSTRNPLWVSGSTLCAWLQTHAPEIFYNPRGTYEGVIFFISIRFQPLLTVHTNTMCMLFRFDQFPRAFWNLCVVDENAQSTSVNGRPTRIKMSSFSKENARIRGFSFEISEFFLSCSASFRK